MTSNPDEGRSLGRRDRRASRLTEGGSRSRSRPRSVKGTAGSTEVGGRRARARSGLTEPDSLATTEGRALSRRLSSSSSAGRRRSRTGRTSSAPEDKRTRALRSDREANPRRDTERPYQNVPVPRDEDNALRHSRTENARRNRDTPPAPADHQRAAGARALEPNTQSRATVNAGMHASQILVENVFEDLAPPKKTDDELARKAAERAALRERRKLERERAERERAEAEALVAGPAAVAAAAPPSPPLEIAASRVEVFTPAPAVRLSEPKEPVDATLVRARLVTKNSATMPTTATRAVAAAAPEAITTEVTLPVPREVKLTEPAERVARDEGPPAETAGRNARASGTAEAAAQPRPDKTKMERPLSSPFRAVACPGFDGNASSSELIKALAFRRQKTLGTEKLYHATGANRNLSIDDRVVKTGSTLGDASDSETDTE